MKLPIIFMVSMATMVRGQEKDIVEFCAAHNNSFIAIVWPIAQGKHQEIKEKFAVYGKIMYEKEMLLSPQLAYTILKKSHYNGPPSVTSDFKAHLNWYFPQKSLFKKPARIFVCTFDTVADATACKYAIRRLFKLSYRAVHINDTHAETEELAQLLFGS